MAVFANYFDRIFIVTNQQGIGKGLMNEQELKEIHRQLKEHIEKNGGRIDAIYHCPMLRSEPDNCRKPGLYMARAAQKDFPEVDFRQSMMIGDTAGDMEFGKNAQMKRVLLTNEHTTANDLKNAQSSIEKLSEIDNLINQIL